MGCDSGRDTACWAAPPAIHNADPGGNLFLGGHDGVTENRSVRRGYRKEAAMSLLLIILIVLLVLALAGGGWGYGRYGAVGLSPAAIILIILVILFLTGNLSF